MDQSVKDALTRWPNVPAVYGWLSLDARGRWRLHPQGQANEGGPGEPITNTQILEFISRNYERDNDGRWFFQNGPQRVFVRLDAAPYVLRLADDNRGLITHTDATVDAVSAWWLDDEGRLYASTPMGAGIVLDRDLQPLLEMMRTQAGGPLLDALAELAASHSMTAVWPDVYAAAPLHAIAQADIAARLGFDPAPHAPAA
ncbi:hypothetical protein LMG26689_00931 [Achromobacter animicus]|uniref:DUF2946 family protein n=1 Tax=Achromobacter animicus TaxID=1389935 RepID=UPI001466A322|nr:DUF2946 family protein [Achromobacter animicus]CAB3830691.1 hypothetical protein LMG26689_00931 [Achromobacter animicus]